MSSRTVYRSKRDDLSGADQTFLDEYSAFEDSLRSRNLFPFSAPLEEHRQSIELTCIAEANQDALISELLRYHGWACEREGTSAHHVSLTEILLSYEDLYNYCTFLDQERQVKIRSTRKICQALIRLLKFMRTKGNQFNTSDVENMLEETRKLGNMIERTAKVSENERPSLCERREQGEALSFMDIVKVWEGQHWRVKTLTAFSRRNELTAAVKDCLNVIISNETVRLAILLALLKYPTRKVEVQRSEVVRAGDTWRMKLSASSRKSGRYPIDVKLSSTEVQIFDSLRSSRGSKDRKSDSWRPFDALNATQLLKAITYDFTGVGITVTDLRSAAESHADIMGYNSTAHAESVQKALTYIEGHSEGIAKMFYRRNGSSTVMKPWTSYVDKLLNLQEAEVGDDGVGAIDKKILSSISASQKRWVKEVQNTIQKAQSPAPVAASAPVEPDMQQSRKRKTLWTAEEDEELTKRVRVLGEGNWKDILSSSTILQERYKLAPSVQKARAGLKDRWRNLKTLAMSSEAKPSSPCIEHRRKKKGRQACLGGRNVHYPRHEWTLYEDNALELAVSMHGTNWGEILSSNKLFSDMYDHMPLENAKDALKQRWRVMGAKSGMHRQLSVHRARKRKCPITVDDSFFLRDGLDAVNAADDRSTKPFEGVGEQNCTGQAHSEIEQMHSSSTSSEELHEELGHASKTMTTENSARDDKKDAVQSVTPFNRCSPASAAMSTSLHHANQTMETVPGSQRKRRKKRTRQISPQSKRKLDALLTEEAQTSPTSSQSANKNGAVENNSAVSSPAKSAGGEGGSPLRMLQPLSVGSVGGYNHDSQSGTQMRGGNNKTVGPKYPIGTLFLKNFKGYGVWEGCIKSFDGETYEVLYPDDGYMEDFDCDRMDKVMASSNRLLERKVLVVNR